MAWPLPRRFTAHRAGVPGATCPGVAWGPAGGAGRHGGRVPAARVGPWCGQGLPGSPSWSVAWCGRVGLLVLMLPEAPVFAHRAVGGVTRASVVEFGGAAALLRPLELDPHGPSRADRRPGFQVGARPTVPAVPGPVLQLRCRSAGTSLGLLNADRHVSPARLMNTPLVAHRSGCLRPTTPCGSAHLPSSDCAGSRFSNTRIAQWAPRATCLGHALLPCRPWPTLGLCGLGGC